MTPAARILAIADRWEQAPPDAADRDGFTARAAPDMLRRIATKLASDDPAVAARGAEQLRGVADGWTDRESPAARLWGEAVAVLGPAPATPSQPPPAAPVHPLVKVMAGAYERGRADGRLERIGRLTNVESAATALASALVDAPLGSCICDDQSGKARGKIVAALEDAYAIGTIHGCNDEQTRILEWLANLDAARFDGMSIEAALRWAAAHVSDTEEPSGPQ